MVVCAVWFEGLFGAAIEFELDDGLVELVVLVSWERFACCCDWKLELGNWLLVEEVLDLFLFLRCVSHNSFFFLGEHLVQIEREWFPSQQKHLMDLNDLGFLVVLSGLD